MRTKNEYRYEKKKKGCMKLASLTKKKIYDEDIGIIASQVGISPTSLSGAWKVFQETGGKLVEYRATADNEGARFHPVGKFKYCTKSRDVSADEAGDIILEYMTDRKINSRELSLKHNISLAQFYGWIRELSVSGTLLGNKVLDTKKYFKCTIKDVIWFYKRPNTKRKSITSLTPLQKLQYQRVSKVLLNYLPSSETTI